MRAPASAAVGLRQRFAVAVSHVSKPGNIGPVSFEDSLAPLIDFHLPNDFHPRPFQAEIQAADAGEQ
jgi:hypothetical protein